MLQKKISGEQQGVISFHLSQVLKPDSFPSSFHQQKHGSIGLAILHIISPTVTVLQQILESVSLSKPLNGREGNCLVGWVVPHGLPKSTLKIYPAELLSILWLKHMPIAILKGKLRSKVIILQIQTSHYQVYSLQNYHTVALFEPSTMSNSMSLVFCHIIKTNVCCLKTSQNTT